MEVFSKDGTIKIMGIDFDFDDKPAKWDYKINQDGTRELWIYTYVRGAEVFTCQSYKLTRGKRGAISLDDKPLKGEDLINAKYFFDNIKK